MKRRSFILSAAAALTAGKAMAIPVQQKYKWIQRTDDAGIPARDCGMGFDFRGRMWLSNGYTPGNVAKRDLFASHDGITWMLINDDTPYEPYASICALGPAIYVYDGTMRKSLDGVIYETLSTTNNPEFEPEAPMFDIGGKLHIVRTSHVDTFDPESNSFVTNPHPSQSTRGHARALFDGRLYIIGGAKPETNIPPENSKAYPDMTGLSDVWSSAEPTNPASWVKHADAPFAQRLWPGIGVNDGFLYVTGGYDNFTAKNRNDTWRTKDGITWKRVETVEDYQARHAPTMYSRNGRLIMAFGNTNTGPAVRKDVWVLVPA
jgi:hypothetical protein